MTRYLAAHLHLLGLRLNTWMDTLHGRAHDERGATTAEIVVWVTFGVSVALIAGAVIQGYVEGRLAILR